MKIHPFSTQLRRYWRWAPLTLRTIDFMVVPALVILFLVFGLDDLKAWLS